MKQTASHALLDRTAREAQREELLQRDHAVLALSDLRDPHPYGIPDFSIHTEEKSGISVTVAGHAGDRAAQRATDLDATVTIVRQHSRVVRPNAVIEDLRDETVMDGSGGVRSVQTANVEMTEAQLAEIWSPMHLERLARTYWKFLSKVTLGLIRVVYTPNDRFVVLLFRPFVLLRFHAPDYELSGDRGIVRWRIKQGLLVAQPDRGHLEIDVRRLPSPRPGRAIAHVEVEVANFYPMIAKRFTRFIYTNTQSRIHVLVTHGFLKSLARVDLAESAVGLFDARVQERRFEALPRRGDENVGETPWQPWAALVAAAAAAAYLVLRRR